MHLVAVMEVTMPSADVHCICTVNRYVCNSESICRYAIVILHAFSCSKFEVTVRSADVCVQSTSIFVIPHHVGM